jgi:hypothetical protein
MMDCYDDLAEQMSSALDCPDDGELMLMGLDFEKLSIKKKRKIYIVLFYGSSDKSMMLRTFRTKTLASRYIYVRAKLYEDMDGNVRDPCDDSIYACECSTVSDCGKNKTSAVLCIARNDGWCDYEILMRYV